MTRKHKEPPAKAVNSEKPECQPLINVQEPADISVCEESKRTERRKAAKHLKNSNEVQHF